MYEKDIFKHRAFVALMSSTELYVGFLLGIFVACPSLVPAWGILKIVTIFYVWTSSVLILYGLSGGFGWNTQDDCDTFK